MKIVLISGGTTSGKTSIAKNIVNKLDGKANLISMDDYYFEKTSYEDQENINWDIPSAINFKQLKEDVSKLSEGISIEKNIFVPGPDVYADAKEKVEPRDYLIIEGIFSLTDATLTTSSNLRIFLDSDNEIRYKRRSERDKKTYLDYDPETHRKRWDEIVQVSHDKYVEPTKSLSDEVIDTNKIEEDINKISTNIVEKLLRL